MIPSGNERGGKTNVGVTQHGGITVSHRKQVAVGLLVLALCVPAWAAEGSGNDEEAAESAEPAVERSQHIEYIEVNLEAVPTSNTIATKLPLPLQMTPANVGAVSRPLFSEQAADVLGDALRNVSGLNVQAGSGRVHDFFLIRGFDSLKRSQFHR